MAEKTSDWRPGPTVCRCCLAEGCYKDISTEYFWMGKREVYAEMLSDTLSVSIAYSQSGGPNSNSRLICESCISRLRDATDFKRQVLECEKTFMNLLDPGSSTLVKELQLSMEEVKVEHVKTEKASMSDDDFDDQVDFVVENDDDDDDDDLDDEPLMKLASKEPKKEVNITELLKNSQVTVKRKAAVKAKAPPAKKAKKQIVIKPTASKAAAKATASSTPKTEKKKKGPTEIKQQSDENIPGTRINMLNANRPERVNATIFIEFTTALPFIFSHSYFRCIYFPETYTDVHAMLEHSLTHSPIKTVLKEHIEYSHRTICVDISDLKCRICFLKYTSLNDIKEHLRTAHNVLFTSARYGLRPFNLRKAKNRLACLDCKKEFTSFNLLNSHVIEHEDKFRLICNICGLGVRTARNLNRHQLTHEKISYKCEECNIVCDTKKKQMYHILKYHGVDHIDKLPLKCPHCSERFAEYYLKVKHLKEVHEISLTFECTICKIVFNSRRMLTEHTNKVHLQSIKCEVCDKCFKNNSMLKCHMRHHTGERNFVCATCKKAYMHESKLRKHINQQHGHRFICFKCGIGFLIKDHLIAHKNQFHLAPNSTDVQK